MKIETEILRVGKDEYAWADEVEHGFVMYPAGREVSDTWLIRNGLIDPEPETPTAPAKAAAAKQSPKSADKNVKGPGADK